MRAPGFWYRPRGLASWLLAPLGTLYAAGTARRLARGPRARVGVPVICVGNVTVGGTGKTPTVIALIERLTALGVRPAVVSRGYGGSVIGPHRVDERRDGADEVGDEPLLLSAFGPVFVARHRAEGARAAVAAGAQVVILDDGYQNPALAYDLSIVVVDAARGFGNGAVIPAGPLREPVRTALKRADILLSIGDAGAQERFDADWSVSLPRARGTLDPLQTGMDWQGLRVLAFAGIGDPEKFFRTLRGLGAELAETHALDDHQALSPALMQRLTTRAQAIGARLVTTEKDAVRLPQALRTEVLTVPVRLRLEDWSAIDAGLSRLEFGPG